MLNAMAPTTSHAPLTSFTLRQCRDALALSQSRFAAQLGVTLETYRTWDSGRRPVRPDVLTRANELALRADPHALRPLETLARLIHVHVKTLHGPPETVASGSPMTHGRHFGVCERARPSLTPTPSYIRILSRPRGRRIGPRP
jgi:DNA-binding XRE family transcriptional regulator